MTLVFRIVSPESAAPLPEAMIDARQLCAFRDYLRHQSARLALALANPELHDAPSSDLPFEARVCPLPLASVTSLFDHDAAVVAVVEEAQFRGRRIWIGPAADAAQFVMRVSEAADPAALHELPDAAAGALLAALGIAPGEDEANAAFVRDSLSDPDLRILLDEAELGLHAARLERLVTSALLEPQARLRWREPADRCAWRTLAALSA